MLDSLDKVSKGKAALVDVRSPREYSGELLAPENLPQEGSQRGGHIPGAQNIVWSQATNEDGTFKTADQLAELYRARASLRTRTSSPTAASASAPPTRGSCSPTSSVTRTSATTTAHGPSGAGSWVHRSKSSA